MSNLDNLTAIILAGGEGTRLQSVVNDRPKVMAPVRNKPFLFIVLEMLLKSGIRNIVFSTGYKSSYIKKEIGDSYKGHRIYYSEEKTPLGTSGGVSLAMSRFESEHYLVLNGDNYVDYSFDLFYNFYLKKECDALILVKKVGNAGRYGTVEFDNNNKVLIFKEKDSNISSAFINCGVYLFRSSIIPLLPKQLPSSLEYDFFPNILDRNFYAFETNGRHFDIGTPESYCSAQSFFSSKSF